MDSILIEGLRVEALIGVHAHERTLRQPLLVDLELGGDLAAAAASDDLAATIDYAEVVQAVRSFMERADSLLLERLAQSLCDLIERRFGPRRLVLTLRKPHAAQALGCAAVGVRLVRDRRGA